MGERNHVWDIITLNGSAGRTGHAQSGGRKAGEPGAGPCEKARGGQPLIGNSVPGKRSGRSALSGKRFLRGEEERGRETEGGKERRALPGREGAP